MALARVRTQVCLSVAILTKQGKILLARQFVEMTRMKVENHLATFPKLIGTERQHNTVETAEVRALGQPRQCCVCLLDPAHAWVASHHMQP